MAAYVFVANKVYIGAAADTKPIGVQIGSKAIEYDTDKIYITYDGTNWVQIDTLVKLVGNTGVDIGDVDVLSIAAGSNLIGKVGIDQTTPGTTNRVDIGAALPAGTNLVGKVGIDQTTPGTTNRVDVGAALPAGTANIGDVDEAPIACAAADVHAPAAAAAAVVTYAAVGSLKHVITGLVWSYAGGIPTGGNLKIEDVSGTTVFTMDITEEGPGVINFPKPKKSAAVNTAMIVTLAAAGAGITGKVSVLNHWTEV